MSNLKSEMRHKLLAEHEAKSDMRRWRERMQGLMEDLIDRPRAGHEFLADELSHKLPPLVRLGPGGDYIHDDPQHTILLPRDSEFRIQNSESELKPCPFCGAPPLLEDDQHDLATLNSSLPIEWTVSCSNPQCDCVVLATATSPEEAARRWNTRPAPQHSGLSAQHSPRHRLTALFAFSGFERTIFIINLILCSALGFALAAVIRLFLPH